jgi:hypothetical protein
MEFIFLLGILLLVVGFGFYAWTMIRSVQTRLRNIEEFIRAGGLNAQPSALMNAYEETRRIGGSGNRNVPEDDDDAILVPDADVDAEGVWSGKDGESGIRHEDENDSAVNSGIDEDGVVAGVLNLDLARITTENLKEGDDVEGDEVSEASEVSEGDAEGEGEHLLSQDELEQMKVPELRKMLHDMSVVVPSGSRKGDLIRLILTNQQTPTVPEGSSDDGNMADVEGDDAEDDDAEDDEGSSKV